MKNVLIDSNIYIHFYYARLGKYQELIEYILSIKESIFITEQITNEIDRNKLKQFIRTFDGYIKDCNIKKINIPKQHFLDYGEISEWNASYEKLYKKSNELAEQLKTIKLSLINEITNSTDMISQKLDDVFDNYYIPNNAIYEQAAKRKQTGNPPGKPDDTLGDQLTQEQFLSYCRDKRDDISEIFIVSADYDYFVKISKGQIILNPKLQKDLNTIFERSINVHCFDNLPDFIRFHKDISKLSNKSFTDEVITEAKDELYDVKNQDHHYMYLNHYNVDICPSCKEKIIDKGSYRPSIHGGLTYQFKCFNCGTSIDTLDFYGEY